MTYESIEIYFAVHFMYSFSLTTCMPQLWESFWYIFCNFLASVFFVTAIRYCTPGPVSFLPFFIFFQSFAFHFLGNLLDFSSLETCFSYHIFNFEYLFLIFVFFSKAFWYFFSLYGFKVLFWGLFLPACSVFSKLFFLLVYFSLILEAFLSSVVILDSVFKFM